LRIFLRFQVFHFLFYLYWSIVLLAYGSIVNMRILLSNNLLDLINLLFDPFKLFLVYVD